MVGTPVCGGVLQFHGVFTDIVSLISVLLEQVWCVAQAARSRLQNTCRRPCPHPASRGNRPLEAGSHWVWLPLGLNGPVFEIPAQLPQSSLWSWPLRRPLLLSTVDHDCVVLMRKFRIQWLGILRG